MGEAAGRDSEAARIEKVLSDDLAELAQAEEDSGDKVVEAFSGVGTKIVDAVKNGLLSVHQGVKDVRDELKDVGESADEKMDEVVGFVVDPIRKGLDAVAKELTGSLDPIMGAGIVVGAVYALRDKIKENLTWIWNNWDEALEKGWDLLLAGLDKGWELLKTLWPHIREGLIKLGKTVRFVLDKLWKFVENTLVPKIVDGLSILGQWIWDASPDWLKKGLKAIRSVVVKVMSLAADVGSFILGGLEKLLKAVGLDTLADVIGYLSDVLVALSDWLPGGSGRKTAREKKTLLGKGAGEGTTPASIMASGHEQATSMFTEATEAGLGEGRAAGFAGAAFEDERRANVMMQAFRAAITAGKTPIEALRDASTLGVQEGGGDGAAAMPLGSAAAGAEVGGVASDRAESIVVAREANETLKKVLLLQEQALNEQRLSSTRSAPEIMDTVSSSDVLGIVGTGRLAGGMA